MFLAKCEIVFGAMTPIMVLKKEIESNYKKNKGFGLGLP